MKKTLFIASIFIFSSAFASEQPIMKCFFLESMSISFGHSSVYTMKGNITDEGDRNFHFYEVNGLAIASVDDTGSTNFPGRHLGDVAVVINNHPWGNRVLVDAASTVTTGATAFRILVFQVPSATQPPVFSAYKVSALNGLGLAGSCYLDPRLQNN